MKTLIQKYPPITIRTSQLREITGLSPTTIWRLERDGKFPKRRQIGDGCVGWLYSEVEEYLTNCNCVDQGGSKL